MAKHTEKGCGQSKQARKLRKLRNYRKGEKPMPLTKKVEHLTQTGAWVHKYKNYIKACLRTDCGSTSYLTRMDFCEQLQFLMDFEVNQV